METFEVKKRYEWIVGTRTGKVETYLAEDDKNVYFESGRFVLKENFGIYLKEIDESVYQEKLRLQKEPIHTSIMSMNDLELEKILGNPVNSSLQTNKTQQEESNPIKIILDKQKKNEKLDIQLNISIEVPDKKVIELLTSMFDQQEVIEELIKNSINKLDVNQIEQNIKDIVRSQIISLFNENPVEE